MPKRLANRQTIGNMDGKAMDVLVRIEMRGLYAFVD